MRILRKTITEDTLDENMKLFQKLLHYKMYMPQYFYTFRLMWNSPEKYIVGKTWHFALGYQDRRMVGLALFEQDHRYPSESQLSFFTDPTYRRRGIGTKLGSVLVKELNIEEVTADRLAKTIVDKLDVKPHYFGYGFGAV